VVLAGLAGAVHLVVGFFYLVSGLVAPGYAVIGLLVWWFVLAYVLVRLAIARSWWTPAIPVVAIVTWFAVLTAGERMLGWTP
jgi:hypothetical protein